MKQTNKQTNLISRLKIKENHTKIWKQSDPSKALITAKLHKNCRLGLIESVNEG
jgi:hypothetical protein